MTLMPTSNLHLDSDLRVPTPAPTDGAYVLDRNWVVIDINDQGLHHLGTDRAGAVGSDMWSLLPGLIGTECEQHYRLAMEERTVQEFVGPSAALQGCWLEVRIFPVPQGLAVHLRDITARVKVEERLRDREQLLSAIFSQSATGLAQVDLEGRFSLVNDAYCELTGYTREELMNLRMQDITHPEDLARNLKQLNEALGGGNRFIIEKRYVKPDGSIVWVANNVAVLRDALDRPIGIVAVTVDRTEARKAEEQLRESEERFRLMADVAPQIIWITDADGRTEFFNKQWSNYTGSAFFPGTAAEVAAQHVHPEDASATVSAFEEARRSGTTFQVEHRIRSKDGDYRWFLVRGEPYRDPQSETTLKWFGASVDIHDRKLAEATTNRLNETLAEQVAVRSAERDRLWNLSQDMLARADYSGMMSAVSPAWTWVLGWNEEELLSRGYATFMHPDDMPATLKAIARMHEDGQPARFENRIATADGGWKHIEWMVAPEPDGLHFIAVGRDLSAAKARETELRAAEQARQEADALYRTYFENTPEALFVLGVDEHDRFFVEEVNPAHEIGVGLKLTDIRGKRVDEILPPDVSRKVMETYRQVIETGQVVQYREIYDLNGEQQHWDTSLVPMRSSAGRIIRIIGSSRNVTRQVVAEETLRQSQKMEAIGSVTGGVAHDFNNLLTPIIGSLDMLARRGDGTEREKRLIDGALQSAERAKTLVQRLLAFARRQPLQSVAVDLHQLVDGMVDLFGATLGPTINVSADVPPGLPPAKADPNQIEMALLNLAVNARDAMPEGGELRVSARCHTISEHQGAELPAGEYVCLAVSDTGIGMDEGTRRRAIEPFFSTKGVGRGTGLGLSMVHGLASQLGGRLAIRSTPGEGTTIELWLPTSAEPTGKRQEPPTASISLGGQGTALLVDDEDLVRASTADMLIDLGWKVVEADSAEAALQVIKTAPAPDLLITDHLMPGMTGAELARCTHAVRPELPVLIVSGFADVDGIAPELPRLTKPFRKDELATSLSRLLGVSKQ